jgi:predicted DNA-binding ribbon-helix-helix protein
MQSEALRLRVERLEQTFFVLLRDIASNPNTAVTAAPLELTTVPAPQSQG